MVTNTVQPIGDGAAVGASVSAYTNSSSIYEKFMGLKTSKKPPE